MSFSEPSESERRRMHRGFGTPAEVLRDPKLSDPERIQILREWKLDELERLVAEEEGMGGGPPSRLAAVNRALAELGAQPEAESPNKHGTV